MIVLRLIVLFVYAWKSPWYPVIQSDHVAQIAVVLFPPVTQRYPSAGTMNSPLLSGVIAVCAPLSVSLKASAE